MTDLSALSLEAIHEAFEAVFAQIAANNLRQFEASVEELVLMAVEREAAV